jgi:hypothetical protein
MVPSTYSKATTPEKTASATGTAGAGPGPTNRAHPAKSVLDFQQAQDAELPKGQEDVALLLQEEAQGADQGDNEVQPERSNVIRKLQHT